MKYLLLDMVTDISLERLAQYILSYLSRNFIIKGLPYISLDIDIFEMKFEDVDFICTCSYFMISPILYRIWD